jgi:hypothetical protein
LLKDQALACRVRQYKRLKSTTVSQDVLLLGDIIGNPTHLDQEFTISQRLTALDSVQALVVPTGSIGYSITNQTYPSWLDAADSHTKFLADVVDLRPNAALKSGPKGATLRLLRGIHLDDRIMCTSASEVNGSLSRHDNGMFLRELILAAGSIAAASNAWLHINSGLRPAEHYDTLDIPRKLVWTGEQRLGTPGYRDAVLGEEGLSHIYHFDVAGSPIAVEGETSEEGGSDEPGLLSNVRSFCERQSNLMTRADLPSTTVLHLYVGDNAAPGVSASEASSNRI